MSDKQIRDAQRALARDPHNPDSAAVLIRLLLNSGQMSFELVEQIASLGDLAALVLFPGTKQLSVRELLENINDRRFCVEFAIYCAKKVLPLWQRVYSVNHRPAAIMKATENWLQNSNDENASKLIDIVSLYAAPTYNLLNSSGAPAAWGGRAAIWSGWVANYAINDEENLFYIANDDEEDAPANAFAATDIVAKATVKGLENNITDKQLLIDFLTRNLSIK